MKKSLMSAMLLVLIMFSSGMAAEANHTLLMENYSDYTVRHKDLTKYFGKLQGTAVILNPAKQEFIVYNESLARQRFSPFSTFKIVSALLGLEFGIVKDKKSTMHYNGATYWHPAWNKNVTFKEAFQHSCVWYFRQVIDAIPATSVEKYLQKMGYGNADVSAWQGNGSDKQEELNGFWLNSSLRISPMEQVQVLYNIFSIGSTYNKKYTELVTDFMYVGHGMVYGKTGADGRGQSWFVGFLSEGLYKKYFAFYVKNAEDKAPHAKIIALEFFK